MTLHGINTLDLDAVACAERLTSMRDGFADGTLRPQAIAARFPLSSAGEAYARTEGGERGRMIFTFEQNSAC